LILLGNDLYGVIAVGLVFSTIFAVAEIWRRRWKADPELTRKTVHLLGGVACILFPFLIQSTWVVFSMATLLTAVLAWGAKTSKIKSLTDVKRDSRGSECYPAAIFLVYLIARDRLWLYSSSLLVLAVADAFAALIGTRYGALFYEIEDSKKSLEGSMVFLIIAFLSIHLPTLLLADFPRSTTVLAALLVAFLVTGFEAVSLRGWDNLFVPVGVALILGSLVTKSPAEILYQNLSFIFICCVVGVLRWRIRPFNVGATLVFILFSYATWSLGSFYWFLPVLMAFLVYTVPLFLFPDLAGSFAIVKVRRVFHTGIFSFLLLVVANLFSLYYFLYTPFIVSCMAVLSSILWRDALIPQASDGVKRWRISAAIGLLTWSTVALIPWLSLRGDWIVITALAVISLLISFGNEWLRRKIPSARTIHISITLTAIGVLLVVLLQYQGLLPAWSPD
jgi:dolichol kinase